MRRSRGARTTKGTSLVELLVCVLLMSIGLAAFAVFFVIHKKSQGSTSNVIANIDNGNQAIQRVSRDLRQARSIGDVFGSVDPVTEVLQGSTSFPSTKNPLYYASQAPAAGWPTGTYWATRPWTCDGSTLIVQIPIFDNNTSTAAVGGPYGFPTQIPLAQSRNSPQHVEENVETHVYKVVPDPDTVNRPGEYQLQMVKIPGLAVATATPPYVPANIPSASPQVLLKGIIGPIAAGSTTPQIFQYLNKLTAGVPTFTPSGNDVPDYSGICINIEIKNYDADKSQPKYLALKSECFMRNNASATTTGIPSTVPDAAIP